MNSNNWHACAGATTRVRVICSPNPDACKSRLCVGSHVGKSATGRTTSQEDHVVVDVVVVFHVVSDGGGVARVVPIPVVVEIGREVGPDKNKLLGIYKFRLVVSKENGSTWACARRKGPTLSGDEGGERASARKHGARLTMSQ